MTAYGGATAQRKMDAKEIFALVEDDLKEVEKSINENFHSKIAMIPRISSYLANGGGKRMRPAIVLLTAKMCGYNGGKRDILHSTVIEYIHAATLLHDDVVDSAELRRGMVSANAKWGNEFPVLVGDFLYAKSFSMMSQNGSLDIIRAVSEATRFLAEGQVMELALKGDLGITEEDYIELIFRKTGALIVAGCQIGTLLGEATEERKEALVNYGRNVGIAFQLVDDMLDFTSNRKTLGKPAGQDLAEGHITLPVIHVYKKADEKGKRIIENAVNNKNLTDVQKKEILDILEKHGGLEYARTMAQRYSENAVSGLSCFAPGPYLDALKGLAEFIVERTS